MQTIYIGAKLSHNRQKRFHTPREMCTTYSTLTFSCILVAHQTTGNFIFNSERERGKKSSECLGRDIKRGKRFMFLNLYWERDVKKCGDVAKLHVGRNYTNNTTLRCKWNHQRTLAKCHYMKVMLQLRYIISCASKRVDTNTTHVEVLQTLVSNYDCLLLDVASKHAIKILQNIHLNLLNSIERNI